MLIKVANLYGVSTDYLLGHNYINKKNYSIPGDIKDIKEAISFLENIMLLMNSKTDEEIVKYA